MKNENTFNNENMHQLIRGNFKDKATQQISQLVIVTIISLLISPFHLDCINLGHTPYEFLSHCIAILAKVFLIFTVPHTCS